MADESQHLLDDVVIQESGIMLSDLNQLKDVQWGNQIQKYTENRSEERNLRYHFIMNEENFEQFETGATKLKEIS